MKTDLMDKDDLRAGTYDTTAAFRAIEQHTCISDAEGNLIAVTGPAGDEESQDYAQLFSAAPKLLFVVGEFLRLFAAKDMPWVISHNDDKEITLHEYMMFQTLFALAHIAYHIAKGLEQQ
jgi:hypothetical protein